MINVIDIILSHFNFRLFTKSDISMMRIVCIYILISKEIYIFIYFDLFI
jgi:hypothetical protein